MRHLPVDYWHRKSPSQNRPPQLPSNFNGKQLHSKQAATQRKQACLDFLLGQSLHEGIVLPQTPLGGGGARQPDGQIHLHTPSLLALCNGGQYEDTFVCYLLASQLLEAWAAESGWNEMKASRMESLGEGYIWGGVSKRK